MFEKKKILVTGGAGFIGSHLVNRLLNDGHRVHIIDNFDSFYDPNIKKRNISDCRNNKNFNLSEIDLVNEQTVEKIFIQYKFDIVIHLAAKAGVRPSIIDPIGYSNTNVLGTINLLEAMRKGGCNKMIFASSSSVYGNTKKVPFSENLSVDNPISPYAATKKAGELICHTYSHLYNFDIMCLRFFTVYGPRQRPDLAIHKFTKLIMEGKPIPFFGDGNTERDYTYIDDIVDGITAAINNLKGYNIINLGDSRTISLIKMINTIEDALGKKAIIKKFPMQPGDVVRTFADINKARSILKYNPLISFENGIQKFCDWYLKYYYEVR